MLLVGIFILCLVLIPGYFNRNNIIYSFIFFYPILPEYFALDLGKSIPLITTSRILIIIISIYFFFTCGAKVKINIPRLKIKNINISYLIIFFFLMEVLVTIPYLSSGASVKYMILTFAEKIWLVFVLRYLINTREKLEKSIKCMVLASGILCVGGVVGTVTGKNVFYLLTTAARELTQANYTRLGVTRAEATFGHPISFSMYLLLIIPFIMCMFEQTKRKKYQGLLILAICTLVATITRASIAIFALYFVIMFLLKRRETKNLYYRMILVAGIMFFAVCVLKPSVLNMILQIVASILNIIGFDFDLENFGRNEAGILSRLDQFAMIRHTIDNHALFGGGTDYIYTNPITVVIEGKFIRMTSIDNEYLLVFIEKGILGLSAKLILYFGVWFEALRLRKKDKVGEAFFNAFTMYFVALFTVCELTTSKILWVVIGLFVVYSRLRQSEEWNERLKNC